MKKEMVIVTVPFNGTFLGHVKSGQGKTFEEYQKESKEKLKLITWFEYETIHNEYHSKPFKKIKKKEFDSIKPVVKHKTIYNRFVIIYGKEVSATVSWIYVYDKAQGFYYKGARTVLIPALDLYREIIKDLSVKV